MHFRAGTIKDLQQLKELGLKSWSQFKQELEAAYWKELHQSLESDETYLELLAKSECMVCENDAGAIIGMAFLVGKGNPDEIYDAQWCHLRFVSVDPAYRGNGIGKEITRLCIERALRNNEQVMALHTSEIMNRARHIYEQFGFTILRELPPRLGIRYWLYTLPLSQWNQSV